MPSDAASYIYLKGSTIHFKRSRMNTNEGKNEPGLTNEQRFQVLMAQLQERYAAWHQIRSRSMQFTLWILGLAIAGTWNLLQNPCSFYQQRFASSALVLLLAFTATYFLASLARGARTNREALINIETALGNHKNRQFLADKPLLPVEYQDTKPRASSHFRTLYALLAVTSLYLLVAIWLPFGGCPSEKSPANRIQNTKAQDTLQSETHSTSSKPTMSQHPKKESENAQLLKGN